MLREELRKQGQEVLTEAKSVQGAYGRQGDLAGIAPSEQMMTSVQSFGHDEGAERLWLALVGLHIASKRARAREPDSHVQLTQQIAHVEGLLPLL